MKTPDRVGKADELLKGVDVSVSEDADSEVDDSAEVVVDGAPSIISETKSERDTLGNASPSAVRAAEAAAGRSNVVVGTGSEARVSTLVTAPVASM